MGDRVAVTLHLPKSEYDRTFEKGIDLQGNYETPYDYPSEGQTLKMIEVVFDECNYANIGIETTLQEAKIPYDKFWEQGGDYESGTEYFRILEDGQGVTKEFCGNEETHISLQSLLKAREGGLESVDAFIAKELSRREILPWPDQVKILEKLRDAADLNSD
ncbi:MAG: hypothetical protein LHW56_01905 [Candidatus Cloacimonetes bacterium]|nr:hypothetical protein [Candidatus Cloacimonadota bacterium]MDY0171641.1 hypothetical protein [Candidatus Cloacimonadaceae bacterium]